MRNIVTVYICFALLVGCSSQPEMIATNSSFTGKLAAADGVPVGNVLLTLQPLEAGHPVLLEVDSAGRFQGEAVPGEYAYFVGRSSRAVANGITSLPRLPAEFLEASLDRKVKVGVSPELEIVLQ